MSERLARAVTTIWAALVCRLRKRRDERLEAQWEAEWQEYQRSLRENRIASEAALRAEAKKGATDERKEAR